MPRDALELVDHVAKLAHLSLTAEERALFARQLDQILDYAQSIQALDTSAIEATSYVGSAAAFREDAPRSGLGREQVLAAAPDPADGLFRVPRVIGG